MPRFTALAVLSLVLLTACTESKFRPPKREGPPVLVVQRNAPRLWLMLKQEEQRRRYVSGGSRYRLGKVVTETFYHFDLQAHDPQTTDLAWKRRLATVQDVTGGHNAQARIYGQEGDVVWLFLADQPVAVSADDGGIVADRAMLEQRNPELRDLIPKDSDFYAYDNGLVITAADGRRVKVRAGDYKAEPYAPPSEDYFRNVQFMATRWNGGYRTGDFLTRQATLGGGWLGLYTEKEALDASDDGFGDSLKNPGRVLDEGERARRTFWTARIGRTKEFTEGSHDRLFDLTKLPEAPEFLQGGLLVRQGTRQPLTMRDPEGLLVLHRTRLDEEGRVAEETCKSGDPRPCPWRQRLPRLRACM